MHLCWFFLVLLISNHSIASTSYVIFNENQTQSVSEYYLLKDQTTDTSVKNVFEKPLSAWESSNSLRAEIKQGENWLKFNIYNSKAKAQSITFSIANSVFVKQAKLAYQDAYKQIVSQNLTLKNDNQQVAVIEIAGQSSVTVVLNVSSDLERSLAMNLYGEQAYYDEITGNYFARGVAIGGCIFLAIGLFFLFLASGNKITLFLFSYFISRALLLLVILGHHLHSTFPYEDSFRGIEYPILISASSLFLLLVTSTLFKLKRIHKHLNKVIKGVCWLLLLYIPLSLYLSIITNFYTAIVIFWVVTLGLMAIGFWLIKASTKFAGLFVFIITIQLISGGILSIGAIWPELTSFYSADLLASIMFWFDGLILIFLVSKLYDKQIQEKQVAQKEVLRSAMEAREANEALLELQQENQEQLEFRVQERTLELNIALQELGELNAELAEKSTVDELTGLHNRRHYDNKILAEFRRSRRNLTPLSLVVIDADHFKSINDTYGHLVGDECLIHLAKKINLCLRRSTDIGCRYGGEEFCLILPETDEAGAQSLAEELRILICTEAVKYQGKSIDLTVSCGITTYKHQAECTTELLFKAADKALYLAKENGRNQVQVYDLNELIYPREQEE